MALKQRARKDADKQTRRANILASAARLLGRRHFGTITMAEIAQRCGLAKGTLYLYFASKEELFLAALQCELEAWFRDLSSELEGDKELAATDFAHAVARTLISRETLTDLLAILHTVLERNVDLEAALSFKRMLRRNVERGARLLENAMPGLAPGNGARLLLRTHALMVGLRQMSELPPTVAAVLEQEEFAVLRIDFERDLASALADLVRGMIEVTPATVDARR